MKNLTEQEINSARILEEINSQPWYYENSICDDCDPTVLQFVKRIEDDGLCFCKKHWAMYTESMAEAGYKVEPFEMQ